MTGDRCFGNMTPCPCADSLVLGCDPRARRLAGARAEDRAACRATTTSLAQRYDITRHARRRAAGASTRSRSCTLTNRSTRIDRPRQPVGRPARARLPRDGRDRHGRRPAGRRRVDDDDQPAGPARRPWRRARRVEIGLAFALNVGTSPDAFSARLSNRRRRPQLRAMVPDRVDRARGLRPRRSADLVHGRCHPTRPDHDDAAPARRRRLPGPRERARDDRHDVDLRGRGGPRLQLRRQPGIRAHHAHVGDTTLRVYTQTVDGSRDGRPGDARRSSACSEAFGPYPWPDLVLAEVGAGGGFSMEYPRAIHLTRGKVIDTYVVYHEVAHQWFYAQLGNDQQREPWLDEGFADFSARYLMGIGANQCSTRPVNSEVFAWEAGPITGGDWTQLRRLLRDGLLQGTEFLNGLRAAMGDEAFFAAMREWVSANQHGMVTRPGPPAPPRRRRPMRTSSRSIAPTSPISTRRSASRRRPACEGGAADAADRPSVAGRQGRDGVGHGIGHLVEDDVVDVVDGVAGGVAARVGGRAGGPAEGGGLRIGLWLPTAAEQPSGGDARGLEGSVVGVAGEVDRLPCQAQRRRSRT